MLASLSKGEAHQAKHMIMRDMHHLQVLAKNAKADFEMTLGKVTAVQDLVVNFLQVMNVLRVAISLQVYPALIIFSDFVDELSSLVSIDVRIMPSFDNVWGCFLTSYTSDWVIFNTSWPVMGIFMFVAWSRLSRDDSSLTKNIVWILLFAYIPVCNAIMSLFSCYDLPGGKSYVEDDFYERCDVLDTWRLPVGIVLLLVYAVGVPVTLFVMVYRSRNKLWHIDGTRDKAGLPMETVDELEDVYGDIYRDFKPWCWWWGLMLLIKDFVLGGAIETVPEETRLPMAQITSMIFLMLAAMCAFLPCVLDAGCAMPT